MVRVSPSLISFYPPFICPSLSIIFFSIYLTYPSLIPNFWSIRKRIGSNSMFHVVKKGWNGWFQLLFLHICPPPSSSFYSSSWHLSSSFTPSSLLFTFSSLLFTFRIYRYLDFFESYSQLVVQKWVDWMGQMLYLSGLPSKERKKKESLRGRQISPILFPFCKRVLLWREREKKEREVLANHTFHFYGIAFLCNPPNPRD